MSLAEHESQKLGWALTTFITLLAVFVPPLLVSLALVGVVLIYQLVAQQELIDVFPAWGVAGAWSLLSYGVFIVLGSIYLLLDGLDEATSGSSFDDDMTLDID